MRDPTGPEGMHDMRRRAWLEQGVAVFCLADLPDQLERSFITGIATRLYGRRNA
jgi:hypothetical protein